MSELAIFGGKPVREHLFPSQNTMNENEMEAVQRVMKEGRLSGYRGNWCTEFDGGPEIRELEREWRRKFRSKYAIPVNSCTSGLQIACGAIGLKSGDEVIVSPYSMTCSATAPMLYGAKPVFADIDPNTYCLDPKSVEEKVTKKTKAIIVVDLFGHPYSWEIDGIAVRYGLYVIEDAAQALGACLYGKDIPDRNEMLAAGSLGDIGVFSFNYGKHINCGEGGMIVTDNDELAMRCRLLMNHSEAVIHGMPEHVMDSLINSLFLSGSGWKRGNKKENFNSKIISMPGFNMRMTELQAAVIRAQLEKFDDLLRWRLENVEYLKDQLIQIPAISFPPVERDYSHTYYVLAFQWDSEKADGIHRDVFINAVKAELVPRQDRDGEGVQIGNGYITPLYLMPIFNQPKGLCPVCEDLSFNKLFLTLYHAPTSTIFDMKDVEKAFFKVWTYREELLK